MFDTGGKGSRLGRQASLVCLLAVLPALASPEPAIPGPVDTSAWQCRFCTWPLGLQGWLELGPGWVSDRALKFADYRGLDEQGVYASMRGQLRYLDENGRYLDATFFEPALDSRRIGLQGGRRGDYSVRFNWADLPKYHGFGAHTPFLRQGAQLSLPLDWRHSPTTAGMTTLATSLNPTELKTLRRTLDLGGRIRMGSAWRWDIDVQHMTKKGERPFGAGVLALNASQFAAPVDYASDRVDLVLNYTGQDFGFDAGLSGSWFSNGLASSTWDNPFSSIGGEERLRAALEPDNQFHQFRLGGSWRPSAKLRLSGRMAFGRASQDDVFLPYTSNSLISTSPLPSNSLDGRIDASTLNFTGSVLARLSRRLDLSMRAKFDERDNRTAISAWIPIITDVAPRPATLNRPYSFERSDISLEARYRTRQGARFRAGVKRRDMERTLQSVADTRETSLWVEAGFSPFDLARFRLRLENWDRSGSPYETLADPGLEENRLMRKFHLADRDRERLVAELDLAPGGQVQILLSYYATRDEYDRSLVGLRESESSSINIDASFALPGGMGLTAFASREEIEAVMASVENFVTPWSANSKDTFTTWGLGLKMAPSKHLEAGIDFVSADSKGSMVTANTPFPALRTELSRLQAHITYQAGEHWRWKFQAEHENYHSDDWQLDGLDVDGISAVLSLGTISPDYHVTVLRLLGVYHF